MNTTKQNKSISARKNDTGECKLQFAKEKIPEKKFT